MVIGVLALIGLLVAVYLGLYELQLSGSMVCPLGGECDKVNTSSYVNMFGIPIAVIGIIGYSLILAVDLGWITRRRLAGEREHRRPRWAVRSPGVYNLLSAIPVGLVLIGLSAFGFLFSLFLTYLELFQIRAICTWCVVSAAAMTLILGLSIAGWFTEKAPAD
jgi:uncharacterized membrane protein